MTTTFSKALQKYRKKNNFTQEQVVLLLQRYGDFLSTNTISYHRWEAGKVTPSIKKQAQVMLLLNNRNALIEICKSFDFALSDFNVFMHKRWGMRRDGHDYFYNVIDNESLTIKELNSLSEFPEPVKYSQYHIYYNDHSLSPEFLDDITIENKILLAKSDNLIQGHIAAHTLPSNQLSKYITEFEGSIINPIPCIDNEIILFISSAHSSQETVAMLMVKKVIEFIINLDNIPRFSYLRVYGDNANKFFEKNLSPLLITMGKGKCERVTKNNKKAAYLGYVVPTHLLLLLYGDVLKQLTNH